MVRARPLTGVFNDTSDRVGAWVLPDVQSVGIRPPHGGYVRLKRILAGDEPVWEGVYELPAWYGEGRYTFRFLAVDAARNTFTRELSVKVPAPAEAAR